jgi:hypothetical protein
MAPGTAMAGDSVDGGGDEEGPALGIRVALLLVVVVAVRRPPLRRYSAAAQNETRLKPSSEVEVLVKT